MDKSDIVLVAIIVTIVVLALGGTLVCIILLVVKWKDFLKRRQGQRINVIPADGAQTSDNNEQTEAQQQPPPPYSAPPSPPHSPSDCPPPVYTSIDMDTNQVTRGSDQNPNLQGNINTDSTNTDNVTINYSPPPPYTLLPPRCLITREGINSQATNLSRPTSWRPTGTGTSSQLVTPAGIMFTVSQSRQASGRTIRGLGSRQSSMSTRVTSGSVQRRLSLNLRTTTNSDTGILHI